MPKYRILIVSWNAGHQKIAAGGYVRMLEIFKRVPQDVELLIVDTSPGVYRSIEKPNVRHLIYRVPSWLKSLEKASYNFERILEWLYSSHRIFWIAAKYRHQYDFVYNPTSELLVTSWPCLWIRWILGKHVVFMNLNANSNKIEAGLNTFIHNHVDKVMTISQDLKKALEKQNIHPTAINQVGIDLEIINKIPKQEKKYDAFFIGRHTKEKGIFDLLELVSAIAKEKPDFHLITIGSCDRETRQKLESELKSRQIEKNWTVAGIVEEEEKYKIIKSSKICLYLSYREGWGIVPHEAMACGLPSIVYDLPVYAEHIAKSLSVFRVPIGDWQKAAKEVIRVMREKREKWENWEKIGKEFEKDYSWDKIADREFDILKKIC